ncbi:hypothetical protein [Granulicella sp. S190]|uniref:hypothetical protein n=1 Tax=Granulicella sp. S190 TaxID=1747226 RepID=UPI00131EBD04|nr:hypothetical protein [Granulicella sp. S190]
MLRRLSIVLLLLSFALPLHAQRPEAALSDGEVEQLRESAYFPSDRVLLFVKLLDTRNKSIQDLYAHPRKPGREQDTHDLLEQFTSIADELNDNLDDYGPRHRDIRKALPKLLEATERWSSNLKSPPDNEAYNVSRRLALEAIRDLREQATQLLEDQKTWFLAHPPPKENKNAPIDMPR